MAEWDAYIQKRIINRFNILGISFGELFTDEFMRKHSQYSDIDKLFEAGGYKARSILDLYIIPESELNEFIKNNTDFTSWFGMVAEGTDDFCRKRLRY